MKYTDSRDIDAVISGSSPADSRGRVAKFRNPWLAIKVASQRAVRTGVMHEVRPAGLFRKSYLVCVKDNSLDLAVQRARRIERDSQVF